MSDRRDPPAFSATDGTADASKRLRLVVAGEEPLVFEIGPGDPVVTAGPGRSPDAVTAGPGQASDAEGPGQASDAEARRSDGECPQPEVRSLPLVAADRAAGRTRHEVTIDGWVFSMTIESAARAELRERAGRAAARSGPTGSVRIRAQIPGRLLRVWVSVGDDVEAGQRVLAIEAMKMENEVRAPRAGRVASISAAEGALVELGDELMRLE